MAGQVITSEVLARTHAAPEFIREGSFPPAVKAGPFVSVSRTAACKRPVSSNSVSI
jgi:hypothetical protein